MSDGIGIAGRLDSADRGVGPLPSGRHNLPREFVVTSQRDRLLDAMAQSCAEKRYAEVSVADIVAAGAEWAAFFIGGGGYSLPMRWVEAWQGFRATVAEIDPAVMAFAATIGFRRGHHRIVIRDDDARAVLRRAAEACPVKRSLEGAVAMVMHWA